MYSMSKACLSACTTETAIKAHIIRVELERLGCSFRSRPEWCSVRIDLVLGQVEEQLRDLVDVVVLVLQTSPHDALLERPRTLLDQVSLNHLQLFVVLTRALEGGLDVVGLREIQVDGRGRVDVQSIKGLTGPLDSVLDGVGEVLDGTRGNGLLRWILGRRVGFSQEGNDDLSVCLGTESTGLEQWLLVEHTTSVHVLS
jgi:hypothetical protein